GAPAAVVAAVDERAGVRVARGERLRGEVDRLGLVLDQRAVAELAAVVEPPAPHAVAAHRAGVRLPGRSGCHAVGHLARRHHAAGRARCADLAALVLAPAPQRAADQRAGMSAAEGERGGGAGQTLDHDRHDALELRRIAELAVIVTAPAPDAAVAEPGARVLEAGCDLDGIDEPADLRRRRARRQRAVAELAV